MIHCFAHNTSPRVLYSYYYLHLRLHYHIHHHRHYRHRRHPHDYNLKHYGNFQMDEEILKDNFEIDLDYRMHFYFDYLCYYDLLNNFYHIFYLQSYAQQPLHSLYSLVFSILFVYFETIF